MALRGHVARRQRGFGWFLYPGLTVLVVFFFGMFFWNVGIGMLKWPGYGPATWVGLDNYRIISENEDFWESWAHAFFYVIPFSLLPTAIGLVLAVATYDAFIGRFGSKLVPIARTGFFLPQIVPIAVSGMIWLWMLDGSGGAINSLLEDLGQGSLAQEWLREPSTALLAVSAFMLWLQTGFAYVVFLAGLSRLDPSLVEASQLDGANWAQRLRWITGPALRPEAFVVLLFLTIGALKVFAPVFYLTGGGPYGSTNSPATFAIDAFFGGASVGIGSALVTTLALVIGAVLGLTFLVVRLRARAVKIDA
jgi:raffinose/stachyose/melibiose transport system permease protein